MKQHIRLTLLAALLLTSCGKPSIAKTPIQSSDNLGPITTEEVENVDTENLRERFRTDLSTRTGGFQSLEHAKDCAVTSTSSVVISTLLRDLQYDFPVEALDTVNAANTEILSAMTALHIMSLLDKPQFEYLLTKDADGFADYIVENSQMLKSELSPRVDLVVTPISQKLAYSKSGLGTEPTTEVENLFNRLLSCMETYRGG